MLMLQSIVPAINRKNSRKTTTLQVFFVLSTCLVLPSGTCIYGTLLLPLMLQTTTAKKKTLFAFICMEITDFTDQRTTFMHAQGAILQSRDFNLRVECT